MILKVSDDGTYIEADRAGCDWLINGLTSLRDSDPGTVVSAPWLNGEAAGDFRLLRAKDNHVG